MNGFQIIMLVIVLSFYIVYFLKAIIQKKNGITTNKLVKGKKSRRTKIIELFLMSLTYLMAVIKITSILLLDKLKPIVSSTSLSIIGIVLGACGVIIFMFAVITMKDNWRAGIDESEKTKMVTNGVYRFSRNPAFVGFDLIYIGTTLAFMNIFILLFTIITLICFHIQILEEEKYLAKVFGDDYLDYKKKTKRYLFIF